MPKNGNIRVNKGIATIQDGMKGWGRGEPIREKFFAVGGTSLWNFLYINPFLY